MSKQTKTLDIILSRLKDPAYQINKLAKLIHDDADDHGLWDDFREEMKRFDVVGPSLKAEKVRYYATSVAAGEISEMRAACESYEDYAEELADAVIALLSTGVELGIDVGTEIVRKVEKNRQRPHKHGKERCYVHTKRRCGCRI
jgi:NTP pyrophosphatase (non-canonical NTP hydrolase)